MAFINKTYLVLFCVLCFLYKPCRFSFLELTFYYLYVAMLFTTGLSVNSSSRRQDQKLSTQTQGFPQNSASSDKALSPAPTNNSTHSANRYSISSNNTSPFHSATSSPVNISTYTYNTNLSGVNTSQTNNTTNNNNSSANNNYGNSHDGSKSSSRDNSEEEFVLIPNKGKRAAVRSLVQEVQCTFFFFYFSINTNALIGVSVVALCGCLVVKFTFSSWINLIICRCIANLSILLCLSLQETWTSEL